MRLYNTPGKPKNGSTVVKMLDVVSKIEKTLIYLLLSLPPVHGLDAKQKDSAYIMRLIEPLLFQYELLQSNMKYEITMFSKNHMRRLIHRVCLASIILLTSCCGQQTAVPIDQSSSTTA